MIKSTVISSSQRLEYNTLPRRKKRTRPSKPSSRVLHNKNKGSYGLDLTVSGRGVAFWVILPKRTAGLHKADRNPRVVEVDLCELEIFFYSVLGGSAIVGLRIEYYTDYD